MPKTCEIYMNFDKIYMYNNFIISKNKMPKQYFENSSNLRLF